MKALDGIRVVELADESGAYCGKLLADMGAEVVKVEPPGGDPARRIPPFFAGSEESLFFAHYNTSKKSVVLDLESERGRFAALLDTADVLLVTGTPGERSRRGLDAETLRRGRPALIVAALSPFGDSGPYAEWKSSDLVAQALGGMVFVNGHPGEAPLHSLGLQAYHSASTYTAIGILLALLARRRDGEGQALDVSLQECVAATLEHVSGFYHQNRQIEVRRGTLHWSRYFRVARCKDGYVLHCTLGDWTSLIEWVKMDAKEQDLGGEAWEDFNHRRRNCVHLFDVLDEWAKEYTVADLVEGAQLRRLPYAAVLPLAAVPDNPQLRARGFFVPVCGGGRTVTYPGAPYVFGKTPWSLESPAPPPGAHDRQDARGRAAGPPRTAGGSTARALQGVRVLDFTWVVAGPVATRILADHGADVIKVERRDSLDFGSRRGGLTGNLNRGKRSMVVNMGDPRGIELVRELVKHCDIVIDNFSARVMRNWGLHYDALCRLRPDVIAISMSGFGHSGPHKDYVSYGPTLQALSGYTLEMRHPHGEPAGWGFSYSDMVGGYTAALAALIALWHRCQSGEGQFIDLSQFEAVTAAIGPALLAVLAGVSPGVPFGNRSQERPGAPHGVYRCEDAPGDGPAADRWCAICVFGEEEWSRFVRAIGEPAWSTDPRFSSLAGRIAHQDELDAHVESWTRARRAEDVMNLLQQNGIAAGIVANAADLCDRDPHLKARGYWVSVTTPEGETFEYDGVPARLSRTPGFVAGPGPLLGEHGTRVLEEILGLDSARIEQLRNERVVG